MKIRNGFVSNSSSSSFCLFGICVGGEEVIDAAFALDPELTNEGINKDEFDASEAAEVVAEKLDLEYASPTDSDRFYFGLGPQSISDNETGAQFKEYVRAKVSPVFPGVKLNWYEEGWYDG